MIAHSAPASNTTSSKARMRQTVRACHSATTSRTTPSVAAIGMYHGAVRRCAQSWHDIGQYSQNGETKAQRQEQTAGKTPRNRC